MLPIECGRPEINEPYLGVLDLADVWTVIVKTHVAHKQNLEDEGKRSFSESKTLSGYYVAK